MTESLTERLQAKLATQTKEIEALTSNELTKLAANLQQQSLEELETMRHAIGATSAMLNVDLQAVKIAGRYWWIALIVTWLAIGGLSAWLWMQPRTAGIELYQTFTYEGQTYLLLPDGTRAMTCKTDGKSVPCVALPSGK